MGNSECARLERLKKGLGGSNKNTFPTNKKKNGRGECVFGQHRRERIAFLAENAKHGEVKQSSSAANQCILGKKAQKTL